MVVAVGSCLRSFSEAAEVKKCFSCFRVGLELV